MLQKQSPPDEQQRELLDRAMKALKPRDSGAARDRTVRSRKAIRNWLAFPVVERGSPDFALS